MRFSRFFLFITPFLVFSIPGLASGSPTPYDLVTKYITDLAARYPETTALMDIGTGDSGDKIVGLKIGNGPIKTLVVATHHGNEYGSAEVAKGFAASIAAMPLKDQTTFVVPVLNIWGYNRNNRYEWAKEQTNDPNRDYPGPCGSDGPYNLRSTKLLADFVEREGIISTLTLHTFYPVVVYPWGFSTPDRKTAYEDLFTDLARAAVIETKYPIGNSAEAIYPADGTFEDYVFWKSGVWALLFELGGSHAPTSADIETMIRQNVPGMRLALESMPTMRAANHEFKGKCDKNLRALDKRDE